MTTFVTYTASAGQKDFPIPFSYLSKLHIHALVDGAAVTWSPFNTATARLASALVGGEKVLLYRDTSVSLAALLVDFNSGSRLTADDLDTAIRQVAFSLEEVRERSVWADTLVAETDPHDAGNRKIASLSTPSAPNDAVNKLYADSLVLNTGDLPSAIGWPDGSLAMVVANTWTMTLATAALTYLNAYNKSESDARYLAVANQLASIKFVADECRANLASNEARTLLQPAVNNPGVTDFIVDPGGNWWQTATTKLQITNGALYGHRKERWDENTNVARDSGASDVDPFPGYIGDGNDRRIKPSSVSGTWIEDSSGVGRTYTDDGAGNLVGTGLDAASSIDYETGLISMEASGGENVRDGSVTAQFQRLTVDIDSGFGDFAAQRVYVEPGDWMVHVNITLRNYSGAARTVKAAITDDVSSGATVVHRHLWRTNSRPLDIPAGGVASYQVVWPVTAAGPDPAYLCLRAVADVAASVVIDSLTIEVVQLDH